MSRPRSCGARAPAAIMLLTLTACLRHGTALPVCTLETSPWPGATSVHVDATPTVTLPGFAEAPESLDDFAGLAVLRDAATSTAVDVRRDVSWSGHPDDALRIVLTPVAPLQASHRYRLETLSDASAPALARLPGEYNASLAEFTTDTTPAALAVGYANQVLHTGGDDADLTVLFSEPMELASVVGAIQLHVEGSTTPLVPQHVGASHSWARAVDVVVPDSVPVASVTVTTAAMSVTGHSLAADQELALPEIGVAQTASTPWVREPGCMSWFGL